MIVYNNKRIDLNQDELDELLDIAYDRVRERTADMISTEEEVDAAIAMHRDQINDEYSNGRKRKGDEWELEGYLQATYDATREHLKGVYPDEAVEVAIAKSRHHLMRRHRAIEKARWALQTAFDALPPEMRENINASVGSS